MIACVLLALGTGLIDPWMMPQFSVTQVASVKSFWSDPGRYRVDDQLAQGSGGPYVAASTAEGSTWLHAYYKTFYPGQHLLPDRDMQPVTSSQRGAEAWLDRRIQSDWSTASQGAQALNEGRPEPSKAADDTPTFLRLSLGPAPSFAAPHRARRFTVVFPECVIFAADTPKVRHKFPYLRSIDGVDILGSVTTDSNWQSALRKSKASPQAGRVLQAVASLEGAFDSVNTYDTGRVSVGVVQFASVAEGRGSLGELLLTYKRADWESFNLTFARYGVNVTPSGTLAVLDPATGWELQGPAAVRKIQEDARLTAVFSRAGRISEGFRAAQVKTALTLFWPGEKRMSWTAAGRSYSARLADIFRSDAGMATLMDRSVNAGDLTSVMAFVRDNAARSGAKGAADLSGLEAQLVQSLRYRKDFTLVAGLSRPTEYYASTGPGALQGSVLQPATPQAWQPSGGKPPVAKPKEPESNLPEGADPRYAVPLGPAAEERKPEDFESPLKKKPVEKLPAAGGG